MFGGADGTKVISPAASRYLDLRIYEGVSSSYLRTIPQAIQRLDVNYLWHWVQALPREWQTESALQRISECLSRMSEEEFVVRTLDAMAVYHRQTQERGNDFSQLRPRLPDEILHSGVLCAGGVQPCVGEQQQYTATSNAA